MLTVDSYIDDNVQHASPGGTSLGTLYWGLSGECGKDGHEEPILSSLMWREGQYGMGRGARRGGV